MQLGWSPMYYRRYEKDDGGLFPKSDKNVEELARFIGITSDKLREVIKKEVGEK
jgi:hypothetical protein